MKCCIHFLHKLLFESLRYFLSPRYPHKIWIGAIGICYFLMIPTASAINLKVDRVTINAPLSSASWTSVTFQQPFFTVPVVLVLPTETNPDPASVRIRNVTVNGFEMGVVEPQGEDASTDFMSVDFFAAEVGRYNFPGGLRMVVGMHNTATRMGRNAPGASSNGDLVSFPNGSYNTTPAVIAQVQTINSQPALTSGLLAIPWLETTINSVSSNNFRLALELAETSQGTVVSETIGYLAFDSGGEATLGGQAIKGVRTADNISGWDNGCFNNNFPSAFSAPPIVVASQNSRDGADGGWLRRCGLSNSGVSLTVDEDRAADSERAHTTEIAGVFAIAAPFNALFSGARFEAGRANIASSNASVQWTPVIFPNPFGNTPLVFSVPTNEGTSPASIRLRNISFNGFEIAAFEPPGGAASHPPMTIDYVAIEPGTYVLDNGNIFEAGSISTNQFQSGIAASSGWSTINFATSFSSPPSAMFEIQSNNNEAALDPNLVSAPWITVAVQAVNNTSAAIALERAEVDDGVIASPETVAYLLINNLANDNIIATNGDVVEFESLRTPQSIQGWDEGCFSYNFVDSYATPHAIASQNTRNGPNGGWIRRCALLSGSIGLQVDEDQDNDAERSHTNEIASALIFSQAFEANISQVSNFIISHDGAGINCLREAITIRAVDNAGNTFTNYTKTINLSTLTNSGSWFTVDSGGSNPAPAQGTLLDAVANDGAATYTFVAADNGQVLLYLENTQAETTNINVSENVTTDDNSEGDIIFRPFGFVVSPALISTQIAGKDFPATLTAAGQTPSQPQCGVIEEYSGSKAINFWSTYQTPATGVTRLLVDTVPVATSSAAATAQNVTFTNGVGNINLRYDDVGSISFSARDDVGIGEPPAGGSNEVIGGVAAFVVRPFAWSIEVLGSPNATSDSDPVFAISGNSFSSQIRSVIWESLDDGDNDGIPDVSADLTNNSVTPNLVNIGGSINLSAAAQLVMNSNGVLAVNSVNFASFGAVASPIQGTVPVTQSWSEVGIVTINANTADFMGTAQAVNGQRNNIGRFIPSRFVVALSIGDNLDAQCTGFSYAGFANGVATLDKNGQTDDLSFTVDAQNSANQVTQNYHGVFAKLESGTISRTPFNVTTATIATGTLQSSLSPVTFNSGQATPLISALNYQFDNLAAPFDLRIDISALDSDGVTGSLSTVAVENRLGRLRLLDTYGSELQALEMPLVTEYFDGTSWSTNIIDSCTAYINNNLQFVVGSYTDNLNAGETSVTLPSPFNANLVTGRSLLGNGFWLSAPGENNYGEVITEFDLTAANWLTFDWDSNNTSDNPTANVSFGYYRGSDRVIYWQEL